MRWYQLGACVVVILVGILIAVFGLFILYQHPISFLPGLQNPSEDWITPGKILIVIALLVLLFGLLVLLGSLGQRRWLALFIVGISSLVLFNVVLLTASPSSPAKAIFDLPAAKIQSSLADLQPGGAIVLMLVANQEVHRYNAKLLEVQGVGSEALTPPYKNKEVVMVQVSLTGSISDTTATDVANQLVNANAVFLLPSTLATPAATATSTVATSPTPANINVNPTFVLDTTKIHSDVSILKPKDKVVVFLTLDHQVYYYNAIVVEVQKANGKSTLTPPINDGVTKVTIELTQMTNDTVISFISQLSNASAIYVLLAQQVQKK